MEKKKSCNVSERLNGGNFKGEWKTNTTRAGLDQQVAAMKAVIGQVTLLTGRDKTTCVLAADGKYQVSILRKKMEDIPPNSGNAFQITWSKMIPIKVSTFIWRAAMCRISTAIALASRGYLLILVYVVLAYGLQNV